MYGYVYLRQNLITNEIYIGQHKAKEFEPIKYQGSGVRLKKAIRKYGNDSFSYELVDIANSKTELDDLEIHYIAYYRSLYGWNMCYNVSDGGKTLNADMHDKAFNTLVEKYGSITANMMTEEAREKARNTRMERYGVPYGFLMPEVLKKAHEKNIEAFGKKVEVIFKDNTVKVFASQEEAARELGYSSKYIRNMIKGIKPICPTADFIDIHRLGEPSKCRRPKYSKHLKHTKEELRARRKENDQKNVDIIVGVFGFRRYTDINGVYRNISLEEANSRCLKYEPKNSKLKPFYKVA